MIKKLQLLIVSLLLIIGASAVTTLAIGNFQSTYAKDCEHRILTFPPWYRGLTNADCSMKSPADLAQAGDESGIKAFATTILINASEILIQLAGYGSLIFIIYGGFRYMTSQGEPAGITAAKKTIANASIGLLIALLAVAIVNYIYGVITGGN